MRRILALACALSLTGCVAQQEAKQTNQRNFVLYVGDGMGVSTIKAARITATP